MAVLSVSEFSQSERIFVGITHLQPERTHTNSPELSRTLQTGMSGLAATLQRLREKDRGAGTNSQAHRYLNQDYEALRQHLLETGQLFQDDTFPALTSSLGFNELGPNSSKVRGVSWKRPTVSTRSNPAPVAPGLPEAR